MPTTVTQSPPNMAAFLLAHAGMRTEFGRLAAAVAAGAAEESRQQLIEDQIVLVAELVQHHHAAEDAVVWPLLGERAPGSVPELAALEADHRKLDPLMATVQDTSRPLRARVGELERLHDLLNAHLEREESVAVPLIRSAISAKEWAGIDERVQQALGRRRLPLLFGWLASAGTPAQVAAAVAAVPPLPRLMFKLFWWPSYQRRYRTMYALPAPDLAL